MDRPRGGSMHPCHIFLSFSTARRLNVVVFLLLLSFPTKEPQLLPGLQASFKPDRGRRTTRRESCQAKDGQHRSEVGTYLYLSNLNFGEV
ncbi:hypothetical protein B0H12DRAFT_685034 [Mycena haematopus]|nr:hypothetical protein B0H12DRAFT_685034 [Mycena haematopus]